MTTRETETTAGRLAAAGLSARDVRDWQQAEPGETTDFSADRNTFSGYWTRAARLLGRLPRKARRNESERGAASIIDDMARAARVRFLRGHGDAVYDALTVRRSRFVRVEELVTRPRAWCRAWFRGRRKSPPRTIALQGDKSGLEIDQGLLLSAVLGSERSGRHLCHAMLLPRADAQALLPQLEHDGKVELQRRLDPPRGQSRGRDAEQSALSQRRGPEHARRCGNLRRSRAARSAQSKLPSCAARWWSIRNTKAAGYSAPAST